MGMRLMEMRLMEMRVRGMVNPKDAGLFSVGVDAFTAIEQGVRRHKTAAAPFFD